MNDIRIKNKKLIMINQNVLPFFKNFIKKKLNHHTQTIKLQHYVSVKNQPNTIP